MTATITADQLLVRRSGQVVRRSTHQPLGSVSTPRPPWEWRASCECGWKGGVTWSVRRQCLDQLLEHLQGCPRVLPSAHERRPAAEARVVDFAQYAKGEGFELDQWQIDLAEQLIAGETVPWENRHGEAMTRALAQGWREAA